MDMNDYYTDRHGKPMYRLRGYALRDRDGNRYELVGTGYKSMPFSDPAVVHVWTRTNRLVLMRTDELEIVVPYGTLFGISALVLYVVAMAALVYFG